MNTRRRTKVMSVLAKASIVKNHKKLHDHKKKTVEKTINGMKANDNHIVSGLQEPNSEKLHTAGLTSMMTFCTTKNERLYFSLSFSPISSPSFFPLFLFTPFPSFCSLIHVSPMLISLI